MAIPKKILEGNKKTKKEYLENQEKARDDHGYIKTPSFIEMAKSFTKSAADFIKSGAAIVDKTTYVNRLATCNSCEYLIRKSMRCKACGCLLETKAKMETAYCPLGKWENGMQKKDGKK
jgi:hypothetical protein|tara:strand:+ start:647 stop:1003 length:357 start_codon:yes stop_codon:yes gene_type:complete